jgi:hypothetical protein
LDPDDVAVRVRRATGLLIDISTAREVGARLSSDGADRAIPINGRDILTGLPRTELVSIKALRNAS